MENNERTNDSKTLTLSSESTATDALSPDVLTATSPLTHDEGYPLVEFAHWGQRPRSGGGYGNEGDGGVDGKDEKRGSTENGIYEQSKTSGNGSQFQLLPNPKTNDENGYEFEQKGHKTAWTCNDDDKEELPLTSAIRLRNTDPMDDVPYPLPTSGFLPDITLNGAKDNTPLNNQCDSNKDPIRINDYEFRDDDNDDEDDTQSIHSYSGEQIEAYDRRKSQENSRKVSPELPNIQNNETVESSRKKSKSIFSNPSRMLKIPSISAIVSSKKKKQVEAQNCDESDNDNIDDNKKVFPPLLSSTTPTNDETSDMLAIDLHHPFMTSGLDNGDNYWGEDDTKAPPYTQFEMIR